MENEKQPNEENITIHTLESDMADMGINSEESTKEDKPKDAEAKAEEKDDAEPKKLTRKERRIQRQANENRSLREENEALKKKLEAESKPSAKDEPNIDDFDDYDDYLKAVQKSEEQEEEKPQVNNDPKAEAKSNLLEDGSDDYEDFQELVTAKDLALTEDVLDFVLDSDSPSDVAYYLATHKDETKDIATMTPAKMAKAIAKIELNLENKPKAEPKKVSEAPEPIAPLDGKSAKGKSLDDDDLSFEEHEALLNKERVSTAGWL